MASIALKSLSLLLGLFFIFVGLTKLTCFISKELHRDFRKEYVKHAKVFPFAEMLGIKIPAKYYRKAIGVLEIVCGSILMLIPKGVLKLSANILLLLSMLLNVYSHFMLGDKFERTAPSLVFCFMLVGRLVIHWQIQRQERQLLNSSTETKQE